MSLPFLNPNKMANMIMMRKKADGAVESNEEGEHTPGLMNAAEDLLRAIASKDAKSLAGAIQSAVENCEGAE